MTEDDLQKQEDEQPIVPYGYTQNKIRKKKRFARALRNHFKSLFSIIWTSLVQNGRTKRVKVDGP